ncbi:MAG: NAD(P)H-hydrate epimerase [Candidatus Omnitrophota bacterium]
MEQIVTVNHMKKIDLIAQSKYLIPGIILMENAGLRAADIILDLLKLKKNKKKTVSIFCGPGNNGGDGFVLARHLLNNNTKVKIYILTSINKICADALINFKILKKNASGYSGDCKGIRFEKN